MRLNHSIIAATLVALAAGPAFGQELLKKVESKLQAPGSAAGAPAAASPAAGSPAAGSPATGSPATGAPAAGAGLSATPVPGYLGANVDDTPEVGKGVLITGVKKGAPSELGGLKEGDVIVGIDGKPCRNLDDLDAALAKGTVGSKLSFQVQRAGKVETKIVTLGRRPIEAERADEPSAATADPVPSTPVRPGPPPIGAGASPAARPSSDPAATPPTLRPAADPLSPATVPAAPLPDPLASPTRDPALDLPPPPGGDRPAADPLTDPLAPAPLDPAPLDPAAPAPTGKASLGIQVVTLNDETRAQYGVRSTARQGAVIVSVRPGSAADTAGLPIGGVVVSIDGQLVKTYDDLVDAISAARPGQEVELRYYQGDRVFTKSVRLTPAAARGIVTAPPRPGMTLGNPERPLLRKFEDMVESLSPNTPPPPTAGSSIFDPSRLTEMHNDIKSMMERLDALDKRVKELEAKAGGTP
jgi:membrane-associated protease RseP (regulator of RpoE activity)